MDITNDIQIEQTPFTFRGDDQALRAVVDGALYALPGSRITSRAYGAHLATDYLSFDDAAWRESYTETVRGVEVRRLRAIWIGDARLEGKGPSFSYQCAYIDRAADADAARIELRRPSIRQRDDQSVSMRLHIKLSPVQAAATTGRIEAPALLRFAVDAIMQAIEKADRAAQTVTPTGDAPSNDAGDTAIDTQSDDQAGRKRKTRRDVDERVERVHNRMKKGETLTVVCDMEHTTIGTYRSHCKRVTGEDPLT